LLPLSENGPPSAGQRNTLTALELAVAFNAFRASSLSLNAGWPIVDGGFVPTEKLIES
jgi:hypothetical protein